MDMNTALIITFSILAAVTAAFAVYGWYKAKSASQNRFTLKREATRHHMGSWKHFWYQNRFKFWWYFAFLMIFLMVGFIFAAVGMPYFSENNTPN